MESRAHPFSQAAASYRRSSGSRRTTRSHDAVGLPALLVHRPDPAGPGRLHGLPKHPAGRRPQAGGEEAPVRPRRRGRTARGRPRRRPATTTTATISCSPWRAGSFPARSTPTRASRSSPRPSRSRRTPRCCSSTPCGVRLSRWSSRCTPTAMAARPSRLAAAPTMTRPRSSRGRCSRARSSWRRGPTNRSAAVRTKLRPSRCSSERTPRPRRGFAAVGYLHLGERPERHLWGAGGWFARVHGVASQAIADTTVTPDRERASRSSTIRATSPRGASRRHRSSREPPRSRLLARTGGRRHRGRARHSFHQRPPGSTPVLRAHAASPRH